MYSRIVVPLDGSQMAERSLPHAVELARKLSMPIHLIRVIDLTQIERTAPFGLGLEQATFELARTEEESESHRYLLEVSDELLAQGVVVSDEIRCGVVFQEIIDASRTGDVIVLASHGRGGVSRWFIGSVAEDIVRHSRTPVLLVPNAVLQSSTSDRAATVLGRR